MNKLQKGFTLIELVISITLLSFITIITTSILQNSIIQRNLYIENSNNLENYNSFFGIFRDDFRFIQNVDMLNVDGASSRPAKKKKKTPKAKRARAAVV